MAAQGRRRSSYQFGLWNEPVKGLPYCLGHARIAYRPAGRRRSAVGERSAGAPRSMESV
jgi:hypothetical protein